MRLVEWTVVLALLTLFVFATYSSCEDDKDRRYKAVKCDYDCGIQKSKVLDSKCFCMTEKGWERK